jgi:hypothetical protein
MARRRRDGRRRCLPGVLVVEEVEVMIVVVMMRTNLAMGGLGTGPEGDELGGGGGLEG